MEEPNWDWYRPRLCRVLLLLVLTGVATGCLADSTRVYRCTQDNGKVEFRQTSCADGSQQELEIKDVKVGWEAPTATVKLTKKRKTPKAKRASDASRRNREKQAKDCFKTEQKLENVNRKLRRGYKAGKGSDLRHQRRQYEAYLGRFCQ